MNWYQKYMTVYGKSPDEIPTNVYDEIRANILKRQSEQPLVTVSVIAYNEEQHLTACLWSLSEMECTFPMEIIGVDNDSADRTAEIFHRTGVKCYTEKQHSCGHARLCGLNHARGRYHINIDADTLYPATYVQTMVNELQKPGVVAVSASWSYFPDKEHPRYAMRCYEWLRDVHLWLQHFKRPELSVRGLVFAYHTEPARQAGIRTDIRRGEDGSLALELKKCGTIRFIHTAKAKAVTGFGTVGADGSLWNSFRIRAVKAVKNMGGLFTRKTHYEDTEDNIIN